jgi:hypothetical protein
MGEECGSIPVGSIASSLQEAAVSLSKTSEKVIGERIWLRDLGGAPSMFIMALLQAQ